MGTLTEVITEAMSKLSSFDGTNKEALLWCCKNYQEGHKPIDYIMIWLKTTEGLLASNFPVESLVRVLKQKLLEEQANEQQLSKM